MPFLPQGISLAAPFYCVHFLNRLCAERVDDEPSSFTYLGYSPEQSALHCKVNLPVTLVVNPTSPVASGSGIIH